MNSQTICHITIRTKKDYTIIFLVNPNFYLQLEDFDTLMLSKENEIRLSRLQLQSGLLSR